MGRKINNSKVKHYLQSGLSLLVDGTTGGLFLFISCLLVGNLTPAIPLSYFLVSSAFYALSIIAVFYLMRIHRWIWRYTSREDLMTLISAVVIANLAYSPAAGFFIAREFLVGSALLITAPLLIFALIALRLLYQGWITNEFASVSHSEDLQKIPAIICGSGDSVSALLKEMRNSTVSNFSLLGAILTERAVAGQSLSGIPILGTIANVEHILAKMKSRTEQPIRLILADRYDDHEKLFEIVEQARHHDAVVRRFIGTTGALARVDPANLLIRPKRTLDTNNSNALVHAKRVLVTGAGGTIGSELVRQLYNYDPSALCLIDSSEHNLFTIDSELKNLGAKDEQRFPVLGDIRDMALVDRAFQSFRPQIVIHAAALKHVPLMENNVTEAIMTNILGTRVVAGASRKYDVESFVFISTDKAVDPSNVMGATKRAAELVIRDLCRGAKGRYSLVRFGNVLGSAGSVVPIFEEQIAKGGPVTVTHPDMVRYFMTVQEAAALVLQAASLPDVKPGAASMFVLDMGEPVKIDDLARQLIRLKGLEPDRDIKIDYIGLRPGEKLKEELVYEHEQVHSQVSEGIMIIDLAKFEARNAAPLIGQIVEKAADRDEKAARDALAHLIPSLNHTDNGK